MTRRPPQARDSRIVTVGARALALTLLVLLPGLAPASPVPEFPFVIVTEAVHRGVEPARASVNISLGAYATTSEEALRGLDSARRAVLDAVNEHGLSPDDVTAFQVDKRAQRARREDAIGQLDILGYHVSQALTLDVDDLDRYAPLMAAIIATDGVLGVEADFEPADPQALDAQLIAEAGAAARVSADASAAAQGRTVARAHGITASRDISGALGRFALAPDASAMMLSMDYVGSTGPLLLSVPTSITVSRQVTVLYELEPEP